MKQKIQTICLFILFAFLTACDSGFEKGFVEAENKDYLAAKQKMREGDFEQALELFHRVIEQNHFAPESHLEAGVIYLQQENEPVIAIYHFNQYLQQKPNSRESELVRELILGAKKQFASELPGNPLKNTVSRMELLETIAVLKRKLEEVSNENLQIKSENQVLKSKLTGAHDTMREILADDSMQQDDSVVLEAGVSTSPISVSDNIQQQVQNTIPEDQEEVSIPESYEVKSGDSLYNISMKIYGDADHIQKIFQANRDILKSANDLKPGQVLKLPR